MVQSADVFRCKIWQTPKGVFVVPGASFIRHRGISRTTGDDSVCVVIQPLKTRG